MPTHQPQTPGIARGLTTAELAKALSLHPQSLRKRLSQTGKYYSVRPIKLPNRRLLWPADAVEQLANGRAK